MSTCMKPKLTQLFVLADSISIHYGPYLERFLAGKFDCDRKGRELLSSSPSSADGNLLTRLAELDPGIPALNGEHSRAVLAYLQAQPPQADVLLLNCGLHDLKVDPQSRARQVPLDEYGRNLSAILRLARGCAKNIVWVRTTPVDDELHNCRNSAFQRYNADVLAYNAVADSCARSEGAVVIDLYNFTQTLAGLEPGGLAALIDDHVHFSLATRKLQAAYIAGRLEALHAA